MTAKKYLSLKEIWNLSRIDTRYHLTHLEYTHLENHEKMKPRQIVWHLMNKIDEVPKCRDCDNQVKWNGDTRKYRTFCSKKCSNNNDEVKEKFEQTMLDRHGVKYSGQSPKLMKKSRQTTLELYGNENYNNREKAAQTTLENYGVEHQMYSTEIKEKIQQTNLERYGVENTFQNKEIRKKIQQTNLERYGVKNPNQNKSVRDKIERTSLERYGVENSNQKHIQISQEKYFLTKTTSLNL